MSAWLGMFLQKRAPWKEQDCCYYLHSSLVKVVSGVAQMTLEERHRAKDHDVYRETSFKETICSDDQSTI